MRKSSFVVLLIILANVISEEIQFSIPKPTTQDIPMKEVIERLIRSDSEGSVIIPFHPASYVVGGKLKSEANNKLTAQSDFSPIPCSTINPKIQIKTVQKQNLAEYGTIKQHYYDTDNQMLYVLTSSKILAFTISESIITRVGAIARGDVSEDLSSHFLFVKINQNVCLTDGFSVFRIEMSSDGLIYPNKISSLPGS